MTEPIFEMLSTDGAIKDDYLEFFGVPYYTNEETYEDVVRHYQFVQDLDPESPVPMLVLWANRPQPTREEMVAKFKEIFEDDDDDEDGRLLPWDVESEEDDDDEPPEATPSGK